MTMCKTYNVMFVIDSLSGGGAELVIYNLCKSIDPQAFHVSVCCLRNIGERGKELLDSGYDICELPESAYFQNRYMTFLPLKTLLTRKHADIIHSHSTQGLVDSSLARMLYRTGKHIHTFHYGNYPHIKKKQYVLEKGFSRFPNRLVAVGNEQRRMIEQTFRLPTGAVTTVWNGIMVENTSSVKAADRFLKRDGKITFASISTLIEQKGLTYLLDASKLLASRLNNFRVVIVGEGPLRNELERKCKELRLDGIVEFVGWVDNAATAVLPAIDVFIQSSLWEAMSMVILEAMAAQKPVIVTDVGENKHIVENNKRGMVVPSADTRAMAGTMEELIHDRELRERLGTEAKKWVIANCSTDKMARNYEDIYRRALGLRERENKNG